MITQLVESFVPRKNPLLKNFPIDRQTIRDNFKSVAEEHPFEAFLQKQWLDADIIGMDPVAREHMIKKYGSYLSRQLFGPSGKILCHYTETVERTECTQKESTAHGALLESLLWLQDSLLNDHLSHLNPQGPVHSTSSSIIKRTMGRIRKSLTREKI